MDELEDGLLDNETFTRIKTTNKRKRIVEDEEESPEEPFIAEDIIVAKVMKEYDPYDEFNDENELIHSMGGELMQITQQENMFLMCDHLKALYPGYARRFQAESTTRQFLMLKFVARNHLDNFLILAEKMSYNQDMKPSEVIFDVLQSELLFLNANSELKMREKTLYAIEISGKMLAFVVSALIEEKDHGHLKEIIRDMPEHWQELLASKRLSTSVAEFPKSKVDKVSEAARSVYQSNL